MDVRSRLLEQLQNALTQIAGQPVVDCLTIDGYKFRLADNSWLMIRFSGTEPVLRLYCEAATLQQVHHTLLGRNSGQKIREWGEKNFLGMIQHQNQKSNCS